MEVRNVTRERVLGRAVERATDPAARARGLLGRRGLPEGGGLWIAPCRAIHSVGMRFPFDALFVDAAGRVVGLYRRFPRNRISRIFPSARGVLELPAGTVEATGTELGDVLDVPR